MIKEKLLKKHDQRKNIGNLRENEKEGQRARHVEWGAVENRIGGRERERRQMQTDWIPQIPG